MYKKLFVFLNLLIVFSMLLAACATATETPTVEEPVVEEPVVEEPTEEPVVEEPTEEPVVEEPVDPAAVAAALPRNETLYFNGQQWGPVVGWNPYSSSNNNAWLLQQAQRSCLMFETPYLYNMLDGKQYPLLADGDYAWNEDRTEITFKIKPAAKWSDGTPVTADDVAYTWATHVKYETTTGAGL